jgi:hypothetical protein
VDGLDGILKEMKEKDARGKWLKEAFGQKIVALRARTFQSASPKQGQ